MADGVLSQDEVDALMKGVNDGEIETETDGGEDVGGIRPYDLANQDRIVRGRMPTMEVINERFCRLCRVSIFNYIRKVVDISVEGPKTMKYGEFIKNTPLPASFNIFKLSPLRGLNLLVFDANLIFLIVDNYFGGDGKYHVRIEGREFTGLEQRIIRRLADMIFMDMKDSWQSVYHVDFIFNRSEVNPQFTNIVVPSEIVIVSTFTLELEDASSKFSFCIPYSTIEPIKEKLYGGYQSEMMEVDNRWINRLEEEIRGVELNVCCEIGKANITIEDFLNLNTGDVVQLDKKASEAVVVNVEGVPKFIGSTGLHEGQYAVQITGYSEEGGERSHG